MNIETKITEGKVKDILQSFTDNKVTWNDVLLIKSSPHNEVAKLFGVKLIDDNDILLKQNSGSWIKFEISSVNADYVISSVLMRLKYIKAQQAKK